MCRKVIFSMCVVLVLALVNSASGDSYSWTGDGTGDSWCTPENWDPVGVPGPGDEAIIDEPNKLCVIDCDVTCNKLTVGLSTGPCLLAIISGNVVIETDFIIGDDVGSEGIVNKTGGEVYVGGDLIEGKDGIGTFNKINLDVHVDGHMEIGEFLTGVGHVNLITGVINTHTFGMRSSGGTGTMEIGCNGMLVVDGNAAAQIQGYVDNGWITYSEPECNEVLVDYNNINPGKTTVLCLLCEKAWNPNPVDGANCVDVNVVLSWSPGEGALSHHVYFGIDFDDVSNATPISPEFKGHQDPNRFVPEGPLPCAATFYWRIDEVCSDVWLRKGDVWSFATCCCIEPPEGMVAWWPLDEKEGGVSVDYAGHNDGRWRGSPTPVNGMVDGALRFNGSTDYLEAADHPELNFGDTDNFTIDAWIWVEGANNHTIVRKSGSWYGYDLTVVESGLLRLILVDGLMGWMAESDYPVPTGQWAHVAATVSRAHTPLLATVRFYIDGHDAGSVVFDDLRTLSNSEPLWIARGPFGYFEGKIDEVEIYKRALGADEIKAIFDANSAGKCKCLTRTYDDVKDWNEGEFTGTKVGTDDCNGCLMLLDANDPCAATPFDYAWIANASEGTISKINTKTGKEEARYYTGPPNAGGSYTYLSPSRTTVDAEGNCWVANRNLHWVPVRL